MSPTYTVSTYDVADDPGKDGEWAVIHEHVPLWGLRPIIRALYGRGYDRTSFAVDREE